MIINGNKLVKVTDSDLKNKTFEIPKFIVGISDWAFQYCKNLESIVIPDTVQFLGHGIFDNCINLKEVYISKKVEEIPYSIFNGCESLENINVSIEHKKFYSRSGVLYNKNLTEIVACPAKREKVVLPQTVTSISRNAFNGCINLTAIKLPVGLKNIEAQAFSRCTKLTNIELPENIKNIDGFAFFCSNVKQIILKDTKIQFDYTVLENCTSLKTIVIKTKDNKGIPVPNSKEVYEFLNSQNIEARKEMISQIKNPNVKSGLGLYLYENENIGNFTKEIITNVFNYGRFIIDYSSDKELKNVLTSNLIGANTSSLELLSEIEKLKAYYTKQRTIELDLEILNKKNGL